MRQVDETTCGSACLLMLAATGDSRVMQWLETGECEGILPPEVPPGRYANADERIAAAQWRIQRHSVKRGVGPAKWPKSLGTPPWTAARDARFPGVRYLHRAVSDRGARGEQMTSQLVNALRRGYPVLLYTGGDTRGGATTALPRHVVLAVPGSRPRVTTDGDEVISIYEPSSGLVYEVPISELRDRTTPHPALGHWTHIQWLVLPVPASKEGMS